jgi:hypothetical protein
MEGCIAKGNIKMALYWERWVNLWTLEGWIFRMNGGLAAVGDNPALEGDIRNICIIV